MILLTRISLRPRIFYEILDLLFQRDFLNKERFIKEIQELVLRTGEIYQFMREFSIALKIYRVSHLP
jgi:hypothetical protein